MGIIRKQSIGGTIYSYIGVILGFVNLIIITPRIFDTEQVGLVQLLIAISLLFSQFSTLGFGGVTNRLFPYFRDNSSRHNGFALLLLIYGLSGFLVVTVAYYFIKPYLIETNIEKSGLFVDYIDLLLPLTFITLFYTLFDGYCKALYNSVIGTFLKEFVIRIGNLILLILYFFHWFDFDTYIHLYVWNMAIPTVVLLIYLLLKTEFGLRFTPGFFTAEMKKEMLWISIFSIIGGFSGIAVANIDKYMLNQYLDLAATGVYSIAFYFSSLILIPNRSLSKISITLLAENWKEGNIKNIDTIYFKSSINQFLVASILFLGIWCNVHNIFKFLPPEYEQGRMVILFFGIANILQMISGVNMQIISTSSYYRYQTWLMIFLIVLVVISNMIFIPAFGLTGAAIASLISTAIFVIFRFLFVYWVFRLQPFRKEHLMAIGILVVSYIVHLLIPELDNLYIDLTIRSVAIGIVFVLLTWKLKISEDANELTDLLLARIKKRG